MLKIEIKNRFTGKILFEYSKEDNTVLKTLVEAIKQGADLRGVDLQGADLRGADLRGADLRGADLQGVDLRSADLQGVDLRSADLRGADLQGAYLQGAYLQGEKIKCAVVFTGLYDYVVIPYITEAGVKRVKMGCYDRTLDEWVENFWNNPDEFPNDGSLKSNLRLMAFETAKRWLELVEKK